MRYTIKNLRNDIEQYNPMQILSGSTVYFKEQGRNGYQAVDLYMIRPDGSESCASLLETGTSKECIAKVREFVLHNEGYKYFRNESVTRIQAKALLEKAGIDFSKDFFQLHSSQVEGLVVFAKLTKYRKPKNANGSLGRYFFQHLANKVK